MTKLYCYPIVLDLQLNVVTLENGQLSHHRFPIHLVAGTADPVLSKIQDEFQETDFEEFARIAEIQATPESKVHFRAEWAKVFG